jgi:hypothetical protein
MKRLIGLCLVVSLVVTLAAPMFAQENKLIRYSGTIVLVSLDKSSFTIEKENKKIPIQFDEATKFTTLNKPGASSKDLKEGRRVILMVKAANKGDLIATQVDFRTEVR